MVTREENFIVKAFKAIFGVFKGIIDWIIGLFTGGSSSSSGGGLKQQTPSRRVKR